MLKLVTGLALSIAVAGTAFAAAPLDTAKHRAAVTKLLADNGIRARSIDRIAIEPIESAHSVVKGVLGMVWVDQCADGFLVVRMTQTGVVETAYTRGGCRLPNFGAQ